MGRGGRAVRGGREESTAWRVWDKRRGVARSGGGSAAIRAGEERTRGGRPNLGWMGVGGSVGWIGE